MTPTVPRVVQIGTTDLHGGAATVSRAIHEILERRGANPRMLVGVRRSEDASVRSIYEKAPGRPARRSTARSVRLALHRRLAPWIADDVATLPRTAWLRAPEIAEADVVHAHNLHGSYFNLAVLPELTWRKPWVWTLHDMWAMTSSWIHAFDCPHWPHGPCDCRPLNSLPRPRWDNSRRTWSRKQRIYAASRLHLVAPSEWMAAQVRRGMLRDHPLTVIHNGVDTDRFAARDQIDVRRELDLPVDATLVLFVAKGGAANPWKGWEHARSAVEALAGRPEVRFVCLGGGVPDGLGLVDVGLVRDDEKVASYLAASDVLLYPSIADNCPLAVLEALAAGLPIVTFATGGIPELVRDGEEGAVVAFGDGEALLRALVALVESPERRADMAGSARARAVAHFTRDRMVGRYVDLYREAAAGARESVTSTKS